MPMLRVLSPISPTRPRCVRERRGGRIGRDCRASGSFMVQGLLDPGTRLARPQTVTLVPQALPCAVSLARVARRSQRSGPVDAGSAQEAADGRTQRDRPRRGTGGRARIGPVVYVTEATPFARR